MIVLNQPELDDEEFSLISKHLYTVSGIVLAENKRPLIRSRLMKRLKLLGLDDFKSYTKLLKCEAGGAENLELISAVTTNVTSFFREQHHFDYLIERILPPLVDKAKSGARVRIWSAGCSSGEEPYSIAGTILQMCPSASDYDIKVLATDIDQEVVSCAKKAVYRIASVRSVPLQMSRILFESSDIFDSVRITENARKMVVCNVLNLQGDWPIKVKFDVIFCRNVVIYFDKITQLRLWTRFSQQMETGGYLFVGHSERVDNSALSEFVPDGITTYRRK